MRCSSCSLVFNNEEIQLRLQNCGEPLSPSLLWSSGVCNKLQTPACGPQLAREHHNRPCESPGPINADLLL